MVLGLRILICTAADDMLTVGSGLDSQVGKQLLWWITYGGRNYYA
jgi:hypothetical protein